MNGDKSMARKYSDKRFWAKLGRYAKVAGREVVERALQLYYAAQAPETPKWAQGVICSALAYFIVPLDVVPDFVPAVGYSDDLGVLAMALVSIAMYITPEVKRKARAKMEDWFGGTR